MEGNTPLRREAKVLEPMNLRQYLDYLEASGIARDDVAQRGQLQRIRALFSSLYPLDDPEHNQIWSMALNKPELPDNPFVIAICPIHDTLGFVGEVLDWQLSVRNSPIIFNGATLVEDPIYRYIDEGHALLAISESLRWLIGRLADDFGYTGFEMTDHSGEFRVDHNDDFQSRLFGEDG